MGVKKYFRKQKKRVGEYLKKRYASTGRIDFGKIASDVSKLKGIVNAEKKCYEFSPGTTLNVSTAGQPWQCFDVSAIPQGSTDKERDGASIRVKYLQVRGWVRRSLTAVAAQKVERVRIIVFVDKEPLVAGLGNNPVVTDYLTSNFVSSFKSLDAIKQKRFAVLMDKTIKVDIETQEKEFFLNKRMNMHIRWATSNAAGDAQVNNPIYIAFMSDSDTATAANAPQYEYASRVWYYDN